MEEVKTIRRIKKRVIINAIVFFLIVNTKYFLFEMSGMLAFLCSIFILLFLFIDFFVLGFEFYKILKVIIKDGFADRTMNVTAIILFVIISTTLYKPMGIIDFNTLDGEIVLDAKYNGVGGNDSYITLKDNFTFKIDYGLEKYNGKFNILNDTIYFDLSTSIKKDRSNLFGVIKPWIYGENETRYQLVIYDKLTDSNGSHYNISKNELYKLKKKNTK